MSWIEHYKRNKNAVWIKCTLSDNDEKFIDNFNQWIELKDRCKKENLSLKRLSLQFKSHEVELNINDCDGIYLIRSVMGSLGSESKNYYTFGRINGDNVHKQMWVTPELIMTDEYTDSIKNCFEEAIIYAKETEI